MNYSIQASVNIYQKLEQSKLIPIMVSAIQELSRKVAELESK